MASFHRMPLGDFTKRHSIEDKRFDEVVSVLAPATSGPWLVGGAVRRLLTEEKQSSDFDLGFPSEAALAECKARLLGLGLKEHVEKPEHVELHGSIAGKPTVVQLLRVTYGATPEAVIDAFDFTICQLAFDGTDLISGPFALWDLGRKKLAIHRVTYAAATVRRMLKYAKQGYTFCQGTVVSILEEVAKEPGVIHGEVTYVD